jgi:hypothetical protein
MRRTCLAVTLLAAAACHPDEPAHGNADFSSMDDATRATAIRVAITNPTASPLFLVRSAEFAIEYDAQCPSRAIVDGVLRYAAADCTSRQDRRFDGTLRGLNVPTFTGDPPIDPAAPMTIEMLRWDHDGERYDGVAEQDPALPDVGASYVATARYTVDLDGEHRAFDQIAECTRGADGDACVIEGFVELASGTFAYEGTYGTAGVTRHGRVVLRGVDTLVADLDAGAVYLDE